MKYFAGAALKVSKNHVNMYIFMYVHILNIRTPDGF